MKEFVFDKKIKMEMESPKGILGQDTSKINNENKRFLNELTILNTKISEGLESATLSQQAFAENKERLKREGMGI